LISIILIVILGAAFGSFFNVLVYRLPRRESIVWPGSHCPNCNKAIPFYLNVPVLSYIILGGKCKYCKTPIHWHYLILEIVTPLLWISLFYHFFQRQDFSTELFLFSKYVVFISFGIVIFFIDLFHKIIPDRLSLPLIVIGLALSFCPWSDVTPLQSLLGAAIGFGLFYGIGLLYYLTSKKEGMGGGDIKYIAAIGAFVGPWNILFIIILSSFIAVVVMLAQLRGRSRAFAFGPFLVIGSYLYIMIGPQILDWYLGLLSNI